MLLERNEDRDKYYLRTHTLEGVNGTKEELSPVIRLKECLLRHAAADRGEGVKGEGVRVCTQISKSN